MKILICIAFYTQTGETCCPCPSAACKSLKSFVLLFPQMKNKSFDFQSCVFVIHICSFDQFSSWWGGVFVCFLEHGALEMAGGEEGSTFQLCCVRQTSHRGVQRETRCILYHYRVKIKNRKTNSVLVLKMLIHVDISANTKSGLVFSLCSKR